MDVIAIMEQYMMAPVMVACLIVGWLIKYKTTADNRNIPVIVTICGAVLYIVLEIGNMHTIPEVVTAGIKGMASGFMSVGFHSVVSKWMERGKEV